MNSGKREETTEQEFLSAVKEYERVIYKVCYLYATPGVPLADLYQEVVLNIWKAWPAFRRESKISTWIYRIALNTCITFIRKEKNIPEFVRLSAETESLREEDDPLNRMLAEMYRIISRLGQLEKSIILLYLEKRSYEEIAEITGLTVTNVATRLAQIKEKMRRMKKEDR
ncbi:MAG: sigma-70 family RNA polymerase sigma factor [Bacteroides sp.]|nr:sigma-70 family RNA polymerase sigma factor [Bacteroides sp.]